MGSIECGVSAFPMTGGKGANSYVQNSSFQGGIIDVARPIIEEEIATKFNIKELVKNRDGSAILIADFGCSTGHNSFLAMQIITEAIKKIYESAEFHVLFNDVVSNDFNTLFASLPPDRSYRATGVPGGFHGRLLPESSLHFAFSSYSLHWMSQMPKVTNKGEITYFRERKEVCDAYLDQYSKDIETFLEARGVEMVGGGLMTLLVAALPEEDYYNHPAEVRLLGSCLMDMAKKGKLSEAKVDSFNVAAYLPTPLQLKAILERNHSFSIERMEILENPGKSDCKSVEAHVAFNRAIFEASFTYHFGGEIIDELFDLFGKKVSSAPYFLNPQNEKSIVVLAMLKRKAK